MRNTRVYAKPLKSDIGIRRFTAAMLGATRPLPFSAFSMDITGIGIKPLAGFLGNFKDEISELSIVFFREFKLKPFIHQAPPPSTDRSDAYIRRAFKKYLVEPKIGLLLTALARNLEALRLKFFADVMLPAESTTFPAELELDALRTVDAVYYYPNVRLDGDLMAHVVNRAKNLDHLRIQSYWNVGPDCYTPNLIARLPQLLFSRERRVPPSLSLDTNVVVEDAAGFRELCQRGYNRVRKLNLGLVSYRDYEIIRPVLLEGLLQSLNDFVKLQTESLEDLLLDTFRDEAEPDEEEEEEEQSDDEVEDEDEEEVEDESWNREVDAVQVPPPLLYQFRLPILNKLKRLALFFPRRIHHTDVSPIAPFRSDQFPMLTTVEMSSDPGWFEGTVFPTVIHLHVSHSHNNGTNFHRIFPALKLFQIYGALLEYVVGTLLQQEGNNLEILGSFPSERALCPVWSTFQYPFLYKKEYSHHRVLEEHNLGQLANDVSISWTGQWLNNSFS